jgi:hypothetical protein
MWLRVTTDHDNEEEEEAQFMSSESMEDATAVEPEAGDDLDADFDTTPISVAGNVELAHGLHSILLTSKRILESGARVDQETLTNAMDTD